MELKQDTPLDELLSKMPEESLNELLEAPRQQRARLLSIFLNETEHDTLEKIGEVTEIPVLEEVTNLPKGAQNLPLRIIHTFQCLPIPGPDYDPEAEENEEEMDDMESGDIHLATVWPPDAAMNKWIYAASGKRPVWYLAPPNAVVETITKVYGVGSDSLEDSDMDGLLDEDDGDVDENENAAIIRFINEIIVRALSERATDIHFEPQKETLQIRYRIDGQLDPVNLPENLAKFQSAVISRLKIMARMNISEKRRPQDGRISFSRGADQIDIRISTLPTMYGESISLRLLNQKNQAFTIKDLGLLDDDEDTLMLAANKPHGIILVTGPTGSGKSTTLTAVIRRIQTPEARIITVEDPVEYEVPGINQTQVQSEIGLDFAAALRTILRQDPDIIMVGEIRDAETADISIRASLTGHLVLSTLHTNDSAGALPRLTDMGIEPFLIASSVELILAQRLVRKLNQKFAVPADYEFEYVESCLRSLGVHPSELKNREKLMIPGTDPEHKSSGYHGRLGVFEMLQVSDRIHEMVIEKASGRAMREQAIREGMRTLQCCGWEQCKLGNTSLPEIMRLSDITDEE